MTNEEQAYLQAAATESVPIMRELWDTRVAKSRQRVLDYGVSIEDKVDRTAFAERMTPVWDRFVSTPEMRSIVDDISATRNVFGGTDE